jgi:hypothetical protein
LHAIRQTDDHRVRRSPINGLLPKSFFAGSETFFDKSKARSRRFQNSPFGLKQLESLFFHFAKVYGSQFKTFKGVIFESFADKRLAKRNAKFVAV